jgi:hypothetical protein
VTWSNRKLLMPPEAPLIIETLEYGVIYRSIVYKY